jgi:hypothetical protein
MNISKVLWLLIIFSFVFCGSSLKSDLNDETPSFINKEYASSYQNPMDVFLGSHSRPKLGMFPIDTTFEFL